MAKSSRSKVKLRWVKVKKDIYDYLLTKEFCHDKRFDVEVSNSSKGAVFTYSAHNRRSAGSAGNVPLLSGSAGAPVESSAVAKFTSPGSDASLECKLGTEVSGLEVEYRVPPELVPHLKVTVAGERKFRAKDIAATHGVEVALEQSLPAAANNLHWKAAVNPLTNAWQVSLLSGFPVASIGMLRLGGQFCGTGTGVFDRAMAGELANAFWGKAGSAGTGAVTGSAAAGGAGGGAGVRRHPATASLGVALSGRSRGGILWAASARSILGFRASDVCAPEGSTSQCALSAEKSKVLVNLYSRDSCKAHAPEYAAEVAWAPGTGRSTVALACKIYFPEAPLVLSSASRLRGSPPSFVKLRLGHDSRVSASLTHAVADGWLATVGAQVQPTALQVPDSVKYGLKLVFDDSTVRGDSARVTRLLDGRE